MRQSNPAVADLRAESLIDAKLIQDLDRSGFIDQLYASYGVKQPRSRLSFSDQRND
jgi:hypothetical protein